MKYIYLLKVGDQHYKVGVAKNVTDRVKNLQTSNPNVIEIVTTRIVEDEYAYEASIHNYLQQMKADGGKEWFVLTPEQAVSLAILINKTPSVDITQQITLRTILHEHEKQMKGIADKLEIVSNKLKFVPLNREAIEIIKQHKENSLLQTTKEVTDDEVLQDAKAVCKDLGKASTSLLQRKLSIGYGRAARLIEQLEEQGIIGPADGSKPRKVLI